MRNCFVTGCDNYCKQNSMVQRKMFLAPKDMLEKWEAVLKTNKRPLNKSDRVCERHFDRADIIEFWESTINGRLHLTPRDKPKLRDSVVPSKNLSPLAPQQISAKNPTVKPAQKRKAVTRQESIRENKLLKLLTDDTNDIIDQLNVDIPEDTANLFSQNTHQIILETPETTNKLHELYESAIQQISELSEEDKAKNLANFETLYDEAFDVELPNLLWGIHRDPERKFIAFTAMSVELMNVSKVLIVYEQLSYELKVNGVIRAHDYIKLSEKTIIEELGLLLDEFDKDTNY